MTFYGSVRLLKGLEHSPAVLQGLIIRTSRVDLCEIFCIQKGSWKLYTTQIKSYLPLQNYCYCYYYYNLYLPRIASSVLVTLFINEGASIEVLIGM